MVCAKMINMPIVLLSIPMPLGSCSLRALDHVKENGDFSTWMLPSRNESPKTPRKMEFSPLASTSRH